MSISSVETLDATTTKRMKDDWGGNEVQQQDPNNLASGDLGGLPIIKGITDPSGRYERGNELLGRGASKEVYKAFDHENGVEVAWNQLKVDYLSEQSAAKLLSETQILTQLDNENIIKFYNSWLRRNNSDNYEVIFITELMTSGTLKNYLQKTKGPIKLKVIKNWCRQILKALLYLHQRSPPIIHRDLKCDNIFINGNNGQTKLGDFGLAVMKNREMLTSVLGTPEFMAPELYDENYDEKVDIYAFGMCLLEMVTKDYPYSECDNAAQIYRKVTQGIKPLALGKVIDAETLHFIGMCIEYNPRYRPSVEELLSHEFMQVSDDLRSGEVTSPIDIPTNIPNPNSTGSWPTEGNSIDSLLMQSNSSAKVIGCQVEVITFENPIVNLRMKILMSVTSANKEVKFPFNFEHDTVSAVVGEMIKENVLPNSAADLAASSIRESLKEPLSNYEMAFAKAPFRAELDNAASSPSSTTVLSETLTASSIPLNVLLSDPSLTKPSLTAPAPTFDDQIESEIIVKDHTEVAALLLCQKKEIELLTLFHRREHQQLLSNLKKQQLLRSRQETSITSPVSSTSLEISDDQHHFISKLRKSMHDSAPWLPEEVIINNGNNSGSNVTGQGIS